MPRPRKAPSRKLADRTLVVDNGAYSIKAGFAKTPSDNSEPACHVIPNCLAKGRDKRLWVGPQLEKCKDFGEMAFRRPVEKGYLVNWEAQRDIWDVSFFNKDAKLLCNPTETNLVLTEAPNALQALQSNCDQMVFEEFQFASYYRCIGPSLLAFHDIQSLFSEEHRPGDIAAPAEMVIVVDSGYSHTTVTPLVNGHPIQSAIRRLDVGGKLLTNYLKELVSIRHYNMMDETHLMNEVKESVSYISGDFKQDLEAIWKGGVGEKRYLESDTSIVVDYVLPDYNANKQGYARPHDPSRAAKLRQVGKAIDGDSEVEDFMTLGNERFAVPELLFNPSDVQMLQAGLPEVIMQSVNALPAGLQPAMLANVIVVGGNAKIPGMVSRLGKELRQLAPSENPVRVGAPEDPITAIFQGGANLASGVAAPSVEASMKEALVTREEYLEHGANWVARSFSQGV